MNQLRFGIILLFFCAAFGGQAQAQTGTGTQKPITVPEDIQALLQKNTCLACHKADTKLVGPAYIDVAKKKYTNEQIVALIYKPQPEHWPGYPPMAPMTQVPKDEALKIAGWINSLNKTAKAPAKPAAKKPSSK